MWIDAKIKIGFPKILDFNNVKQAILIGIRF